MLTGTAAGLSVLSDVGWIWKSFGSLKFEDGIVFIVADIGADELTDVFDPEL